MENSFRERVNAKVRADFLNCLANKDFSIEHKVDVHTVMGEGGAIDYKDDSFEFKVKSARMVVKKDEHGGHKHFLKIIVE